MQPTRLAKLTGLFVNFGFYAGILICFMVPFIIKAAAYAVRSIWRIDLL